MSRQSEKSNAKPKDTPVPAQIREAQRKSKGKDEVFTDDEVTRAYRYLYPFGRPSF